MTRIDGRILRTRVYVRRSVSRKAGPRPLFLADSKRLQYTTRMVQLPATAAIEYVAAVDACLIYIISSV